MIRKHILAVDDNRETLESIVDILSDEYKVMLAENGAQALEILKKHGDIISLIFLDGFMPVMGGREFLEIKRKDPKLAVIPVIGIATENTTENEIRALEAGVTDYVQLPLIPEVIRHRVDNLISFREAAQIASQFMYDSLTGVFTKEYFYKKLRERLTEDPDTEYKLVCCNLESFKLYNDAYGRQKGNELLDIVLKHFVRELSQGDFICRYRADRFVALMKQQPDHVIKRQHELIKRLNRSKALNNVAVDIGVYHIVDPSIDVEQMCDRVFLAADGINGSFDQYIAYYDDEIRSKIRREQQIIGDAQDAMAEGQFTVYYQPKYNLADDRIVGAEALVRWNHPVLGFVSPGEFIPIFETNGFVSTLDEYVREQVCKQMRKWLDKGCKLVPVSMNLSRADIYHKNFVKDFVSLIEKYDLDPSLLHIEITESTYARDMEQLIYVVNKFREHGIEIEMDDFGKGYSSLEFLCKMAVDVLKIDGSFVRSNLDENNSMGILPDIINIAHRKNTKVVAEGVEFQAEVAKLKEMECDYVQGFYYARPMPADEFKALLDKNLEERKDDK